MPSVTQRPSNKKLSMCHPAVNGLSLLMRCCQIAIVLGNKLHDDQHDLYVGHHLSNLGATGRSRSSEESNILPFGSAGCRRTDCLALIGSPFQERHPCSWPIPPLRYGGIQRQVEMNSGPPASAAPTEINSGAGKPAGSFRLATICRLALTALRLINERASRRSALLE